MTGTEDLMQQYMEMIKALQKENELLKENLNKYNQSHDKDNKKTD